MSPHVTLPPHTPLVDEPVEVEITGCAPGEHVAVRATSGYEDATMVAEAVFEARADGSVDLTTQPSIAGTFVGVDPFGLWWSGGPDAPGFAPAQRHVVPSRLEVQAGGGRIDVSFERRWAIDGVEEAAAGGTGFRGSYLRPPGPGPFPAVVAFGGSGGGLGPAAAWAPVLASRGVATLAIAFFGMAERVVSFLGGR